LINSHNLNCKRHGRDKNAKTEQQLGVPRQPKGISGWDAVILWWRYQQYGDRTVLATLLEYNRGDVMNLKVLREKLEGQRI
jgi:hypothetical protein